MVATGFVNIEATGELANSTFIRGVRGTEAILRRIEEVYATVDVS